MTLRKLSLAVDNFLRRSFFGLGLWIAKRPGLVILLCLLLTICCGTGFLFLETENNENKLYTPSDAESQAAKEYVDQVWGVGLRSSTIYVTAPQALTASVLLVLLDTYQAVLNHQVEFEQEVLTFEKLCAKVGHQCSIVSVLDLFHYNRTTIAALTDQQILHAVNQPILYDTTGRTMGKSALFGGQTTTTATTATGTYETITNSTGLSLRFELENNIETIEGETSDRRATAWEETLPESVLFPFVRHNDASVFLFTPGGADQAYNDAIRSDSRLVVFVFLGMMMFACLILARPNSVYSQSTLGVVSIICIMGSIISGFGVAAYFSKFSLVVLAAAFLMVGLGLDDTFVIINALRSHSPNQPVADRIAQTLEEAGPAITITSVTDICAFVAGTYTTIPAIQIFCTYSALGVLFDFLFQTTLFVAFLALDLRRQDQKRIDGCCCITVQDEDNDCFTSKQFDHQSQGKISTTVTRGIATVVLHPLGKIGVLLIACGLAVGGVFGAMSIEKEFRQEWFVPDGTYIHDAVTVRNQLYGDDSLLFRHWVFTQEGDYFNNQDQLARLSVEIESVRNSVPGTVSNWYPPFVTWLNTTSRLDSSNATNFVSDLVEFLNTEQGQTFSASIILSQDNSTIISTQISVLAKYGSAGQLIETMDDCRSLARLVDAVGAVAYNPWYHFMDGLKVIDTEFIRNLIFAGVAVFAICLVLLANFPLALLVIFVLAVIDVELLAWAHVMGLHYNAVTVMNGLIAVGIAVDYNVHIAHAFMTSDGDRQQRAHTAITTIGSPVLNGASSTFLAVLLLGAAVSYVYHVFFVMILGLVAISIFHGMCVLPVLLSLVGPPPYEDCGLGKTGSSIEKTSAASTAQVIL